MLPKCAYVLGFGEIVLTQTFRLHREVEAFTNWMSPSPVEDEIRGMIVTQISKEIQSNFPDAKILPFGSYETKLYLPLGCVVRAS